MGNDVRMPYDYAGRLSLGSDYLQMQSMLGLGDYSGLGTGGLGSMTDFSSLFRSIFPQYSSPQETPEKRAEKIAELDKKIEEAETEVKKEKTTLEEKETEKKEIEEKKFGFGDGVKSVLKGATGIVIDLFYEKDEKGERHPSGKKTLTSLVVGGLAVGASFLCPPLGVALAVGGAALSGVQIVKGVSDASNAKTYADKDAAVQEITEGGVGAILSVIGFKGANSLKAAKMAKTASGMNAATDGLYTEAKISAAGKAVKAFVSGDAELANNEKIAPIVEKALANYKKFNGIDFCAELEAAGVGKGKAIDILTHLNVDAGAKDIALIHKVETAIKTISNPKSGSKEIRNAAQKLGDLLNLTEQDGLSAEVVAELTKVKASPQYGQLLGASGNRAALAARGRMIKGIQNEDDILATLKGLTNLSEKDKTAVDEAITLLEQLKKSGANKEQVKGALAKLLSDEVELTGEGMLKSDIAEALRALKPTMTDRAISAAEHTKDGVYAIGRGTKKVVTHPFTEPKSFGLNVLRADNFFAQVSNQRGEARREVAQAKTLDAMDKGITAQKDTVTKAKTAYRQKLEELAGIYKINVRNDKHEPKSDKKLSEEIADARENERKEIEAKKAKEAAAK